MSQKRRIIFRADGNSQIGLGHVVRSLALADMLRHEFECVFAIQAPSFELQDQIKEVCHGLLILPRCTPEEERFTYELRAYVSSEEIVVLDGYHFKTEYQQRLKDTNCILVCIDDIHAYSFVADAVINQAGGIPPHLYSTAPYTKLILGPKFALLRQPFLYASKAERTLTDKHLSVFLNMGGADPMNKTLGIAKELSQNANIKRVEIVVGTAYRHLVELQLWLQNQELFSLHHDLTAQQMQELMSQCTLAVTSASGIAYEYAAVGGVLFVLQTADNQAALYQFLTESRIAKDYKNLHDLLNSDSLTKLFSEQINSQRQHFDGHSDERLRHLFQNLSLSAGLILRKVEEKDKLLLFDWANDPEVRKNSFNPNLISLPSHSRWFDAKINDKQTLLYIAEAEEKAVAHIRFSIMDETATISYLIGADFRGKGLGFSLLQKGIQQLIAQRPGIKQVEGLVQSQNIASIRIFEKAGFSYGKPDTEHPEAHRFILLLK